MALRQLGEMQRTAPTCDRARAGMEKDCRFEVTPEIRPRWSAPGRQARN